MTDTRVETIAKLKRYAFVSMADGDGWLEERPDGQFVSFNSVAAILATEAAPSEPETLASAIEETETENYADLVDMANVGKAFMRELANNMPGYSYLSCPSEAICDLINQNYDANKSEFDPYGEEEQAGMMYALRIFGKDIAKLETWEGGDGSESVDGDVYAEFHNIAKAAGWINADGDAVFGPQPSAGPAVKGHQDGG